MSVRLLVTESCLQKTAIRKAMKSLSIEIRLKIIFEPLLKPQ